MTPSTSLLLRPDDPRLTWRGIVSLERTDQWVAPWRLPHQVRGLFPPQRLQERAQMPADAISLCLGINVQGGASLSLRTLSPAIIGFVQTVREGHPEIPLIVMSPIVSPPRETTPNVVGLTLPLMRQEIETAVRTLREYGDANLHYVDGLSVLGPDCAHLLPDDLHPNVEGYKRMGRNLSRALTDILAL